MRTHTRFVALLALLAAFVACDGRSSRPAPAGPSAGPSNEEAPENGRIVMSRWLGDEAEEDVFTVRPDGRRARRLTSGDEREIAPAWRPDGRRIAFVRDGTRARDLDGLWIVRPNGTHEEKVYEQRAINYFAWSPDGKKIALSGWDGRDTELYVLDVSAGEVDQLTDTPDDDERHASWSPDGSRIAFDADRAYARSDVYTIGADGAGRTALTDDGRSSWPEWSPYGGRIAFLSARDDPYPERDTGAFTDVYVMDAGGGNETRVGDTPESWERALGWVTSDLLVWVATYDDGVEDGDAEIFVARVDGTQQVNLTDNRGFDEFSTALSPDGRWIAYSRHKDGVPRRSGLFKIRIDGSGERKLLPVSSTHDVAPGALDWGPRR